MPELLSFAAEWFFTGLFTAAGVSAGLQLGGRLFGTITFNTTSTRR